MNKSHSFFDLNSSTTIPSAIIDLVARGADLYPFNQGRNIKITSESVKDDVKKITIIEGRMNLHRQVKWKLGDCMFTKTFVCPVEYDFGDSSATLKYQSLARDDYAVLGEMFYCYDDMESSLGLVKFFADVIKTLFNVDRVSNFIVWNYGTKGFMFKSSSIGLPVPIGEVDCSNMEILGEFLRMKFFRGISREELVKRVRLHYPG